MNAADRDPGGVRTPLVEFGWRAPLLTAALRIATGFGLVWFAVYLMSAGELRYTSTTVVCAVALTFSATAALKTALPESIRVTALQTLFLAPVYYALLYTSPSANTGLCLALLVIVISLYYGLRAGKFAIAGVFALYVVFGLAWSRGYLPLHARIDAPGPDALLYWVRMGLGQVLGAGSLVAITYYVVNYGVAVMNRLREREQLLQTIIDGSNDGIWDNDLATGTVSWSDRVYKILGMQKTETNLTVEQVRSLVHPDDLTIFEAAVSVRYDSNANIDAELRMRRGDESYGRYQVRGKSILGRDGQPVRVVGSIRDVTERRRAEEALKANESLLRQFVKHTPAAVAMFDRELRYIQVSDGWLKDYRLVGQELAGRSHYDVFPDVPAHWKAIHQRALSGSIEHCAEDPFERQDGSTDWLHWQVQPWRNPAGEIGGVIMFTQVITEQKVAAQKIRDQLTELRRWQRVMLGREERSQQLKREVNELCRELQRPARYATTDSVPSDSTPLHRSSVKSAAR